MQIQSIHLLIEHCISYECACGALVGDMATKWGGGRVIFSVSLLVSAPPSSPLIINHTTEGGDPSP